MEYETVANPSTEAHVADATAKLTDAEVDAILATPEVFFTEVPEVKEDEAVTIH